MVFSLISILCGLLALATLLPVWQSEKWWIRGLDFPRLQLSIVALALLTAEFVFLDLKSFLSWLPIGTTLVCFAIQSWWVIPYLPVYPKEVMNADPAVQSETVRVMAVNVLTTNRRAEPLLQMIQKNRPDVLIAVETDQWWEKQLDMLEADYPHRLKCPMDNLYGMHVYSRLPMRDTEIQFLVEPDVPSMHFLAVLPSGRGIRFHCLHPAPPSPTENEESSERDAEIVVVGRNVAANEKKPPVIVAGDLNDVAWSKTTRLFRKVSGLLDPRVGRGMYNTFHARYPFMRWSLDHLFHSDHFTIARIERLDFFGSDHFPIVIELAIEPSRKRRQNGLDPDAEDRELAAEKAQSEPVKKKDVHTPG